MQSFPHPTPRTRARRDAALAASLFAAALLLDGSGCSDETYGGPVDPYAAPNFVLQDLNPSSPTYLQNRSPSDQRGGILVLYFASFT